MSTGQHQPEQQRPESREEEPADDGLTVDLDELLDDPAPPAPYQPHPADPEGVLTAEPAPPAEPSGTAPSPHTPQPRAGGKPAMRERATGWVLLGARHSGTTLRRLGAAGWWTAGVVWRRPFIWGVLIGAVVWASPVTVGQLLTVAALIWSLAVTFPGEGVTRSERVTSLTRWSTFRNRRRRIKRRWVKLWTNAGLAKPAIPPATGKRVPELKRARLHPLGVSVTLDGSQAGVGMSDVVAHAHELCTTIGARSLRVRVDRRRGVNPYTTTREQLRPRDEMRLRIDFKFRHPFPEPIRAVDLPPCSRKGFVVVGLDEDHRPLERDPRLSFLGVGASGSGKSSELWAFLRGLREAGIPFRLRVFDPKGGTELRELEPVAYHYERNPARWSRFIGFAARALEHRQAAMRTARVRNVDLFDTRFPLDVMVIDELMLTMAMAQNGDMEMFGDTVRVRDALPVYLSQIRSANAMVFALSQNAEKTVLETARDLFTYVSCLRVPQQATSTIDILFGAGAHNAYPAHELIPATREAANDAGIGWCRVEKEGVVMYRGGFLTDAEREREAELLGEWTAPYRRRTTEDDALLTAATKPRGRRPAAPRKTAGAAASGSASGAKPGTRKTPVSNARAKGSAGAPAEANDE